MFVDVHNHILDYLEYEVKKDDFTFIESRTLYPFSVIFCTSSNEKKRYIKQKALCDRLDSNIIPYYSFGIHPQKPEVDELSFLEELLHRKEIDAIGECGFDLFEEKYRSEVASQKKVWEEQLRLAIKYEVPMIVHARNASHIIFSYTKALKKLKAVIFHGFQGNIKEGNSLLKRGINAYFCIGKALLRGKKSQIELATEFDITRLLTETDAPYMSLKEEMFSKPKDIERVVKTFSNWRNINIDDLKEVIHQNFYRIFIKKLPYKNLL